MKSSGSSGKLPMGRRQLVALSRHAACSTNAGSSEDDDVPGDTVERLGMQTAVLASRNDRLQGENDHLNVTVGAQQEALSELAAQAAAIREHERVAKEQLAERVAKVEAEAAALKEQVASLEQAQAHAVAPSTAAVPPTPAPSAASPKPSPSPEAMAELLDTPAVEVAVLALREAMEAGEGGIGPGAHLEVVKKAIKARR